MKLRTDLALHLYENRYLYLLAATLLQVFFSSLFPHREAHWINGITFSVFMFSLVNFLGHNRRIVLILLFFGLVGIVFAWIPTDSETGRKVFPFEQTIIILFLILIITQIILQIVKSRQVSLNMILGVITIYILFGLLAGECNQFILFYDHEAFTGNIDVENVADIRYYSYVTITTLGYGDIAPVSELARATAVFFSLMAQIYLAVVIALIVGKYVSHSDKLEQEKKNK